MVGHNVLRVPLEDGEHVDVAIANQVLFGHLGICDIDIPLLRRRMGPYVVNQSAPNVFRGLVLYFCGHYMTFNVRIFDTGYFVVPETRSSVVAIAAVWHVVNILRNLGYPEARVLDLYTTNIIAVMKVPVRSIDVARVPKHDPRFNYSMRRFPGATCAADKKSDDPLRYISAVMYPSGYVVMPGAKRIEDLVPMARAMVRLARLCEGDGQSAMQASQPSESTLAVLDSIERMENRGRGAARKRVRVLTASQQGEATALVPAAASAAAAAPVPDTEAGRRLQRAFKRTK